MVNRLILNLKQAGRPDVQNDSMFPDQTQTAFGSGLEQLVFAENPLLGNIGAPVRTGYTDEDDFFANTQSTRTGKDTATENFELKIISRDVTS